MSFEGHIENGVAVFDSPVTLPDGLKVRIVPVAEPVPTSDDRKTLAERFKNIIGKVDDLPADMAENHDKYLHGAKLAADKNWRSTVGMFAGDASMKEIIDEGHKIRTADRENPGD